MANTALLVGNSQYRSLSELACCHDDLQAMRELLEAAEKFAEIEVIEDVDADGLKSRMRAAIDKSTPTGELFFYFTGHGFHHESEFYYCATNFDAQRPNETGLSNSELHTLLRLADAELVVKVIDACNSGTLLIKADGGFVSQQKDGFRNLIQISSCLESQNSLTGDPLSLFTDKFRAAALRKLEGIVYYTDIVYAVRDEFLLNSGQTPFFVSQGTGREEFVADAKRFDALRTKLAATTTPSPQPVSEGQHFLPAPLTLRTLLEKAELSMATAEQVTTFIGAFFDGLIKRISTDEFADFFDLEVAEHSDFREPTARDFIVRVLSKESRPDNFVTATITLKKKRNPWASATAWGLAGMWGDDQDYSEIYSLDLNCSMERAQMKVTFTPKYQSLRRIILVVTCAPSLQNCYIFEIGTRHRLRDFGKFDVEGDEVVRRWYKARWSEGTDGIVAKISARLAELVREHLGATERGLTNDTP